MDEKYSASVYVRAVSSLISTPVSTSEFSMIAATVSSLTSTAISVDTYCW